MSLFLPFLTIAIFFLFSILLKKIFKAERWCALCLAVSGTWIILLILQYLHKFDNPVLIALLMGQSIIGIMYLLEEKISEKWLLFRLPFLMSMIFAGYLLLTNNLIPITKEVMITGLLIAALWIIFGMIFTYRNSAKFNAFAKSIIECCKGW